MARFKVGDRLRCLDGGDTRSGGSGYVADREFTVNDISEGSKPVYWPKESQPNSYGIYEEWVELVTNQGEEDTMSDITSPNSALRAKLQNVDEVTKTLRKYNMEDASGERMSAGTTALQDRLWAENRLKIANDLQVLEAEANAPAVAPEKA